MGTGSLASFVGRHDTAAGTPRRRTRSRRWTGGALLLLATGLAPRPGRAQEPAAAPASVAITPYAAAIHQARTLAEAAWQEGRFPGLSIAVGIGDRIVWAQGFGFADIENGAPVTPLSRFRIGSVSKTVTADGLMKLWEQGKVDLDVPIQRYVPDFPKKRWTFTLRQLGGHLAGIRHYKGDEFEISKHYNSLHEGLSIFWSDSLLFRPGTQYHYSSYGWNLIGAVMAAASGEPFVRLMRETVFEPEGLAHTVPDWSDSLIANRVDFYQRDRDGTLMNTPAVDNSYKWSSGGFLSTPSDLVRFALSHVDGESILKPETIRVLWTSQKLESGQLTHYGIGWRVEQDDYGRPLVGHTGGSVGGTTAMLLLPDEKTAVAITVNLTGAPGLWQLAETVSSLFAPPATARAVAATTGVTGRWAFETDSVFRGPIHGTLTLERHGDKTVGWLETERGPWSRVILVRPEAEGDHVMAVGPEGIVNLWLKAEGETLTGRWASGRGAATLRGHRLSG